MRADCTGKRLFHNQIALRFGSKIGWVEICCARFLDASSAWRALDVLKAMGVLDPMGSPVQRVAAFALVLGELGVG